MLDYYYLVSRQAEKEGRKTNSEAKPRKEKNNIFQSQVDNYFLLLATLHIGILFSTSKDNQNPIQGFKIYIILFPLPSTEEENYDCISLWHHAT